MIQEDLLTHFSGLIVPGAFIIGVQCTVCIKDKCITEL